MYCNKCKKGDPNNCFICESSTINLNGKCLLECPDRYFKNNLLNICEICHENCLECIGKDQCLKCISPWVLLENQCHRECPDHLTIFDGVCIKCSDINCIKCDSNNKDKCLVCNDKTKLYNYECLKNCPSRTFIKLNVCVNCVKDCIKCNNENICENCLKGMKNMEGKCVYSCIIGYFSKEDKCLKCSDENCLICSSHNVCLKCNSKTFLDKYNDNCLYKCMDKFFPNKISNECDCNLYLIIRLWKRM